MENETVLILRTCNADMTSYNNFKWPESGRVEAPDWRDDGDCGRGLHGWLNGEGDGSLGKWDVDAKWLVVRVLKSDVRDLVGKVKFPKGDVVFCGDRKGATEFLVANGCDGMAIIGGTATAGDEGTATAGFKGTATAGFKGTATAGDEGTATAGFKGTATAGDEGTATAGFKGTATAGFKGTATAGDEGTATAGDEGTATAGDEGTATAGKSGLLCIKYYDYENNRYRMAVAYVGENDVKAGVKYRLNEKHEFKVA
jgi:hypothetical protein